MVDSNPPLKRYRCHKEVQAGKIREVARIPEPTYTRPVCKGCVALRNNCGKCERCQYHRDNPDSDRFVLDIVDGPPINVSSQWLDKHRPCVGGYLIVYADNYMSFSPAQAFESGYTLIS